MKVDAKKLISRLLLGFVLISIGFVLGKEATVRRMRASVAGQAPTKQQPAEEGEKVIVYYMHATIRCVTCNQIEEMAAEVVNTLFADAKKTGKVVWNEVDFQENAELATRFDVISSCVVVAKTVDGKVVDFKRLDDVWTLAGKTREFNRYVADAILAYLKKGGE
ncbi:MAG: hypothetical protein HQ592_01125 [Planctomycetes bacterium]|nr:hypothetical protein [Planctomycetota bacterium]